MREKIIDPDVIVGAPANEDLPANVAADYGEAAAVLSKSPRAAAALLRLAIQKLVMHLGEPGKDLNRDIGALVAKGLPTEIQQALDVVRVIGNESVHPGLIDVGDDPALVSSLFVLVNAIADRMLTQPKLTRELYSKLPPAKLEGIAQRDRGKEP